MDEKFTIRDIIVYFITGFLFFLVFVISYPDFFFRQIDQHKDFMMGLGLATLPLFYILGHFVDAIDVSIFSHVGKAIDKWHIKRPNFVNNMLDNLFNGHRIRGIKKRFWKMDTEFEDAVMQCSENNQFNEARYWSYLNDTFKGYTLTFFVFSVSGFVRGNFTLGLILFALAILFRQRGRFFGKYYVHAIARIYSSLKKMIQHP